jgi:hypothetical protein
MAQGGCHPCPFTLDPTVEAHTLQENLPREKPRKNAFPNFSAILFTAPLEF